MAAAERSSNTEQKFSMCGHYSKQYLLQESCAYRWFNEKKALESPRRDNTCTSMGKFEKIRPKSRSERCFLTNFSDFFRKPQGLPKGRFEDFWRFFDVLELQGPSLNDPGSIWETSFFHKNSQKNEPEKSQEWKNENSQYPTKLRFEQAIRCSFSWETRWWSQISNWFPKFHKC